MRQYWLVENSTIAEFESRFLMQWPCFNRSYFEEFGQGLHCILNRLEDGSCFDIGNGFHCFICVSAVQLAPKKLIVEIDLRHPGYRKLNGDVAIWLVGIMGGTSYETKRDARMSRRFHGGMPDCIQYRVDHRGDIVCEASVKPVGANYEDLVDLVKTGFEAHQDLVDLLEQAAIDSGELPDPRLMTDQERKAFEREVGQLTLPHSLMDRKWAWERAKLQVQKGGKIARAGRKRGKAHAWAWDQLQEGKDKHVVYQAWTYKYAEELGIPQDKALKAKDLQKIFKAAMKRYRDRLEK